VKEELVAEESCWVLATVEEKLQPSSQRVLLDMATVEEELVAKESCWYLATVEEKLVEES
jgi:hypothetical protein